MAAHDPLEDFAHRALRADRTAHYNAAMPHIMGALRAEGIDALVLKGAVLARWLYGPHEVRGYADIDVYVDPARFTRAGQVLETLGFQCAIDQVANPDLWTEAHAQTWHRHRDEVWVDLHWRLPGTGVSPDEAWDVLWPERDVMALGPSDQPALSERGRALHLASHLAPHGPKARKAAQDLERGIARLAPETWHAAAELARQLDATTALAAGLRLLPEGRALARQLGVDGEDTLKWDLLADHNLPWGTMPLLRWREARGPRAKARIALRAAWPPPEQMDHFYRPARGASRARQHMRHLVALPARALAASRALAAAQRARSPAPASAAAERARDT